MTDLDRAEERHIGEVLCCYGADAVRKHGPACDIDDYPGTFGDEERELLDKQHGEDWWRRGHECACVGWRAGQVALLRSLASEMRDEGVAPNASWYRELVRRADALEAGPKEKP